MARGGARPGAGRKKGSGNVKSREIAERALAEGITPLEFMLQIMRDEACPDDVPAEQKLAFHVKRFEAAKAAAPYVHPRLNAVEHTGKDGEPIKFEKIERVIVKPQ
jgi:hypothetical protein